jgi:hypothetical protein
MAVVTVLVCVIVSPKTTTVVDETGVRVKVVAG